MTRRVSLTWPDPRPFQARDGRPILILAASDEPDPALDFADNRHALGRIDLVLGCGDLPPDQLAFLTEAFVAPLVYVRGNHDRGGPWVSHHAPVAAAGIDERSLAGVALLALPWPAGDRGPARRDEASAWRQVVTTLNRRLLFPSRRSWLVVSHVPPRGIGDTPTDPYHVGFAAYRTVLERLAPRLWLHGHTARSASAAWQLEHGPTTLINVTGSVLIELRSPT
jgi:hypothetical protein